MTGVRPAVGSAALAGFAGAAEAVPEAGTVVGSLRTPHGTAIPGGVVTVTAPDGRQVGRAEVDQGGTYALHGLPSGTYMVVATAPGFRPEVATVALNGKGAA